MWTPPLSIPFRIFLPQTACASIWCFINKSPAYPSLTDIEITSAFLMMQVQLCLALEILLLYMISLDSQHVLHTFPSNSSMFFLPVSSSRSFFFFLLLPPVLHLCLRHSAPQTFFSLSPILVASYEMTLLIQLRCSFRKIWRDTTRILLTVHWAVQFYLVTCHEEKKKSIVFSNCK